MALITSYATLQSEAVDWILRSGQSGNAPTWIQLGEARLNRELGAVETDTTLTGTISSRRIDLSAVSMTQPIALFLAESGRDEVEVLLQADGTFPYLTTSGRPSLAAIDGTYIDFDRPLDAAYPFRLRYRQRFALSVTDPNWLLTNHPDIYLAATLMWGAGYNEDWANGQIWKSILDEGIPSVRRVIAANKQGVLNVDPALTARHSFSYSDWLNGG